ncbi:Uncharacterised protein [Mycobacteroides abscessus subsp. abscessus]|nr:Uncharacterised protein [Mycobacteroides abscessus subsp. abscessus]
MRGDRPLPREPGNRSGALSSTRHAMPRRVNSQASVRPVGPAPAITTVIGPRVG